jgi:hypothetical protein
MIGAGTFINPLLKIVTTVVILGAVYLFLVKPILDTTNDTINRAFDAAQPALRQAEDLANQHGVPNLGARIRRQDVSTAEANRIVRCMRRADSDVEKLQRCVP